MLTNANVAKVCMQKKEKTLAELVSGNPQTLCSQSLETQVSEIRASSNWLQTIIHRTQSRWHQSTHESNEHELQTIYTVATCTGSQDSLSEHSEIPQFESTSEHLYPVDFGEHMPECKSRPRLKFFMLMAHVAMLGYLLLVWRQLLDHMRESFAWHPILMSVALVMSLEGVVILQYAPWPVPYQHRKSRKFHYVMHSIAGLLQIAGIIKCTLNGGAQQGAGAAHKVIGMVGGTAFVGQFLFGVCLATRSRKNRKHWYKYHRATGYGVLVILWTAAWLGVHSKWSQSKRAPSEWLWLICFGLLIVSVLVPVDLAKFGFRHRPY